MIYTLDFEQLINFDTQKTGITLDVELRLGQSVVSFPGKIDTGSTNCVFERKHGEKLGLEVEDGEPLRISTATGSFLTFGHSLTLITENLEFDSMIFFAENEYFRRNILGRSGFLDRVTIGLNDYEGLLYLSKNKYE